MNIRLYHPNSIVENTTKILSKEHGHYVANVMRLKLGSRLNFFNKDGEWLSEIVFLDCLLYTSPSPRDATTSRMPSSA